MEPYKIHEKANNSVEQINCKTGLVLNIWHMTLFIIHDFEGQPHTMSVLWPEMGTCEPVRGGVKVSLQCSPLVWMSRSLFDTLTCLSLLHKGPNFPHTPSGVQLPTFISQARMLSVPPPLRTALSGCCQIFLLSDIETLSTGTAEV